MDPVTELIKAEGQIVEETYEDVVADELVERVGEEQEEMEAGELAPMDDADNVFNPILFTRGIETDSFYLILSGKVTVCSGNEGFMIT